MVDRRPDRQLDDRRQVGSGMMSVSDDRLDRRHSGESGTRGVGDSVEAGPEPSRSSAADVVADSVMHAMGRPERVALIASGGLDSTVLAYCLRRAGAELIFVSFDYGQRHRRELSFAATTAAALGAACRLVDLSAVGRLMSG